MNRFNRRNNNNEQYSSARDRVKKNTPNKIDLTIEMFPELSSTNTAISSNISIPSGKLMSESVWSPESVKDDDGHDDSSSNNITTFDINDTKYWKGTHWTGPAIIRGNTKSSESRQESNRCRIEYSRDNIHWYSSWEKTFSEAQIERRQMEKEQEESEEIYRIMDEYVYRIEEESDRHYRETDELDDYAKAVFARNKYEEYAKQFDMPDEIESVEYEEEDGYLEEDY